MEEERWTERKKMSERKWPFVKCDTISKHGQEDGKNCSPNKKTVACCDVSRCAIRILRPQRTVNGGPLLIMKANSAACILIALLVPPPTPFSSSFPNQGSAGTRCYRSLACYTKFGIPSSHDRLLCARCVYKSHC